MLDTKDKQADLQSIVKHNCKHLKCQSSKSYCSFSLMSCFFDGTLGDWKIKPVSFQVKEENNYTMAELSQC
jgi:hypothetical protein